MTVLIIITVWFISIFNFALGVLVATWIKSPEIVKKYIADIPRKKTTSVGLINRPRAIDVNKRGTIQEQTEEAMIKSLREAGLKPKYEE